MIRQLCYLAVLLPLSVGCVTQGKYNKLYDDYTAATQRIHELEAIAMDSGEDADRLRTETERWRIESEKLRGQTDSLNQELRSSSTDAARRIAELQAQLARQSEQTSKIPGVETIPEAGAFTYRIGGEFLFDPGKDTLKASGKKTLSEVAELLRQHNYHVEVAGHTDTDPVKATKDRFPMGNIQLGTNRALAVWEALKESGVPEDRMSISSYGQHHPVGSDKSKNRRVEIRVLLNEPTPL